MTQRLSALIPIFILNISLTIACTSIEAEVSARLNLTSSLTPAGLLR